MVSIRMSIDICTKKKFSKLNDKVIFRLYSPKYI